MEFKPVATCNSNIDRLISVSKNESQKVSFEDEDKFKTLKIVNKADEK